MLHGDDDACCRQPNITSFWVFHTIMFMFGCTKKYIFSLTFLLLFFFCLYYAWYIRQDSVTFNCLFIISTKLIGSYLEKITNESYFRLISKSALIIWSPILMSTEYIGISWLYKAKMLLFTLYLDAYLSFEFASHSCNSLKVCLS